MSFNNFPDYSDYNQSRYNEKGTHDSDRRHERNFNENSSLHRGREWRQEKEERNPIRFEEYSPVRRSGLQPQSNFTYSQRYNEAVNSSSTNYYHDDYNTRQQTYGNFSGHPASQYNYNEFSQVENQRRTYPENFTQSNSYYDEAATPDYRNDREEQFYENPRASRPPIQNPYPRDEVDYNRFERNPPVRDDRRREQVAYGQSPHQNDQRSFQLSRNEENFMMGLFNKFLMTRREEIPSHSFRQNPVFSGASIPNTYSMPVEQYNHQKPGMGDRPLFNYVQPRTEETLKKEFNEKVFQLRSQEEANTRSLKRERDDDSISEKSSKYSKIDETWKRSSSSTSIPIKEEEIPSIKITISLDEEIDGYGVTNSSEVENPLSSYEKRIKRAAFANDIDTCNSILNEIKQKWLKPSTFIYNTILKYYTRLKDEQRAQKTFEKMIADEVEPDVKTFTMLINSCINTNDEQGIREWLRKMDEAGVSPNVVTYTSVIKYYVKADDFEAAFSMYEGMKADKVEPDEFTFSSLFSLLIKKENIPMIHQLLGEMAEFKVKPNKYIVPSLMDFFVRKEDAQGIRLIMQAMRQCGIIPNLINYTKLIHLLVKKNDVTGVIKLLMDMDNDEVKQDKVIMFAVIDMLVNMGAIPQANELFKLLPGIADRIDSNTIDLHRLSCGAAYMAFLNFLQTLDVNNFLVLITGKGHSKENKDLFTLRKYLLDKIQGNHPELECVIDPNNEGVLKVSKKIVLPMPTIDFINSL